MRGLYGKYKVEKVDGSQVDPSADYFVLRYDLDGEPSARRAILYYANLHWLDNPQLALDIYLSIRRIDPELVNEYIPRLISTKSIAVYCAGCGRWYSRYPAFLGDLLDKGDQCEHCGATSFGTREGRPFGPKSRGWAGIVKDWQNVWPTLMSDEYFRVELLPMANYDRLF